MTDFSKPYTSFWRVVKVNPETWEAYDEIDNVTELSISRDATSTVPMLESGSMRVVLPILDEFEEGYYRIQMLAKQGSYDRHDVGTFLAIPGNASKNGTMKTQPVSLCSVLKPADEIVMVAGSYIYKGSDGADWVGTQLRKCLAAPVFVDGSFTVDSYHVFSGGTTYLEAVWEVLDAAGWCRRITGHGEVHVMEKPKIPIESLDRLHAKDYQPSFNDENAVASIPNRYYATDWTGERVVVVNENQNSRTSFQKRGRYIDYWDDSPTLINGESLLGYAKRRLKEESTVIRTIQYTRTYSPDITVFDMVSMNRPDLGLVGDARIMSQDLTLGDGIILKEAAGLSEEEYDY